jgi:hypothetical protein
MNLQLDAAEHRYRLDGSEVPGVTRVLRAMYDFTGIRDGVLEHKRQIGDALHHAIELDLRDDLDIASLDQEVVGYFEGWLRFRRETYFISLFSEKQVASTKYRYAGTLDFAGFIEGAECLIDGKTTAALHPAVALQTAAYHNAACEMGLLRPSAKRYALRLKPDGTYVLDEHKDRTDFFVFLSCLSLHNWRARNRIPMEMQ